MFILRRLRNTFLQLITISLDSASWELHQYSHRLCGPMNSPKVETTSTSQPRTPHWISIINGIGLGCVDKNKKKRVAESTVQDQTARMCRLILLYTLHEQTHDRLRLDKVLGWNRLSLTEEYISKCFFLKKKKKSPAQLVKWWACRTYDPVVVGSIPGWGQLFFRRFFASHLCWSMWEK